VVVNVQRFAATGLLTVFSKAKQTIGFDKNPWSFLFGKKVNHEISTSDKYIHEVDRNQKLIESITDSVSAKPRLYPSLSDFEKVKDYRHPPYVCIAPASVWFTKQYPKAKWIDLISKLPAHLYIYLIGAPSDKELCEEIKSSSQHANVVDLAGKLTFLQSAALQNGARMNYVNDSAPMHFASSVDAPVTAIYCSTVPSFGFGPLSTISNIVQTKEPLSCKPCGLHGYKACPLGHFKCAHTIEDEQLLQHLNNQKKNIESL
jgi:heptosyltransferase-2